MRAIARDLNVSKGLIRRVIHEVLRYKSYVMRRGQFISAETRNHRLIRGKRLLNKLEHPIVPNMLGFNPTKKILTKTKEPIGEMTGGYAQILQRFPVLCARSFPQLSSFKELWATKEMLCHLTSTLLQQGLRVNAAAYIEVLETVVKPWIDSVCGDRPYVFQQDCSCTQSHDDTRLDGRKFLWPHHITQIYGHLAPRILIEEILKRDQ